MNTQTTPKSSPAQREGGLPVLHDYLDFRADPLQFWIDVGKSGPLVRVRLGPTRAFWVVTDADLFQIILQKNSRNYPRDHQLRDHEGQIDPGETVFNAPTYEEWLWRRRLLQPAFHMRQLRGFAETMINEAISLLQELSADQEIELASLMKRLTMRIICKTMFSASVAETDILQESFELSTKVNYQRLSSIYNLPLWVPTPLIQKAKKAVQARNEIIGRIVKDRLESGDLKGDLLDMLIAAHLDEEHVMADGRRFTGDDLVSEMISIVFAGHETTAMTLMWLFYTLSQNPEIYAKVMAEIDAVVGERRPTLEDIDQMPYTEWVILETLRFYPPVYATLREAEEDDLLGGYHVPAGTQFLMNIRGLHRDERYWDEPERFWPERFSKENSHGRHKFAFQPFISGPKKCIGDSFAMMEMQLVVPTILQQLSFHYVSPGVAREKAGFVMETQEEIRAKVKMRSRD